MTFFKTITIISGGVAGLCLVAVPLWALGVPGVENQYAKGWKMGLNVILLYPAAWSLIYLPYFLMRHNISVAAASRWRIMNACIALVALLLAAWRMTQAFKTMS